MKKNNQKFIPVILVTALVLGSTFYFWQNPRSTEKAETKMEQTELENHASDTYSFQYPKSYKVSEQGEGNEYVLTVSKDDRSKLEIFDAKNYPGDRAAFGFSGEETDEELKQYMKTIEETRAKEYLEKEDYDVWLYYKEGDEETKSELMNIFKSIKKGKN